MGVFFCCVVHSLSFSFFNEYPLSLICMSNPVCLGVSFLSGWFGGQRPFHMGDRCLARGLVVPPLAGLNGAFALPHIIARSQHRLGEGLPAATLAKPLSKNAAEVHRPRYDGG